MERLLGFDAQLLFESAVTAINLFLLFFFLSYLFFNPIKEFLERRQKKISGDLESAAAAKKTALELKEDYRKKLKYANKEAETILEEADKKARLHEHELLEAARAEVKRMKANAAKELEMERLLAADQMRQEIVTAAAGMAITLTEGLVDAKAQEILLEKALREMGEVKWRQQ